ncbi:hypothetical protein [Agreia sp. COWG]|uniref:hypothetical protein n=1 Tax=Agreia sp. COWG TaxID=2773266 RepID=UPI001926CD91|nr:hypothetical protein [Agreia sp. COWG]CAD5989950.1 conserved exported protein of unknown function [Agreia sp. COWG]
MSVKHKADGTIRTIPPRKRHRAALAIAAGLLPVAAMMLVGAPAANAASTAAPAQVQVQFQMHWTGGHNQDGGGTDVRSFRIEGLNGDRYDRCVTPSYNGTLPASPFVSIPLAPSTKYKVTSYSSPHCLGATATALAGGQPYINTAYRNWLISTNHVPVIQDWN